MNLSLIDCTYETLVDFLWNQPWSTCLWSTPHNLMLFNALKRPLLTFGLDFSLYENPSQQITPQNVLFNWRGRNIHFNPFLLVQSDVIVIMTLFFKLYISDHTTTYLLYSFNFLGQSWPPTYQLSHLNCHLFDTCQSCSHKFSNFLPKHLVSLVV